MPCAARGFNSDSIPSPQGFIQFYYFSVVQPYVSAINISLIQQVRHAFGSDLLSFARAGTVTDPECLKPHLFCLRIGQQGLPPIKKGCDLIHLCTQHDKSEPKGWCSVLPYPTELSPTYSSPIPRPLAILSLFKMPPSWKGQMNATQ